MEPAGACPAKKSARVFVARRWKSNDVWTAPTGCVSAVATSACATARQPRRARQVLPAYGLQDSPQIHSQEFTKVLLQAIHGGHFNMAENRTFLLCVDRASRERSISRIGEFRRTTVTTPTTHRRIPATATSNFGTKRSFSQTGRLTPELER